MKVFCKFLPGAHIGRPRVNTPVELQEFYQEVYDESEQMLGDGNAWMLLDPCESNQNADRLLKVWTPVVEFLEHDYQEALWKTLHGLKALSCSFHRAHRLAAECLVNLSGPGEQTC